jgi:hypothetical protein
VAAFARAASLILSEVVYHFGPYDRFVDVFTYMVDQLDLNVWSCRLYYTVSEAYITRILGDVDVAMITMMPSSEQEDGLTWRPISAWTSRP